MLFSTAGRSSQAWFSSGLRRSQVRGDAWRLARLLGVSNRADRETGIAKS